MSSSEDPSIVFPLLAAKGQCPIRKTYERGETSQLSMTLKTQECTDLSTGSGPQFPRCCKDSKYTVSPASVENPAVTSGQPDRGGPCCFPLEFED